MVEGREGEGDRGWELEHTLGGMTDSLFSPQSPSHMRIAP